jgi:hypothetical protein
MEIITLNIAQKLEEASAKNGSARSLQERFPEELRKINACNRLVDWFNGFLNKAGIKANYGLNSLSISREEIKDFNQ